MRPLILAGLGGLDTRVERNGSGEAPSVNSEATQQHFDSGRGSCTSIKAAPAMSRVSKAVTKPVATQPPIGMGSADMFEV